MAFDAGADWVSVVSGAVLTTVEVVVNEAQKRSGNVQIELFDGWTTKNLHVWRNLGIRQVITNRSRDLESKGDLTWRERDFDGIRHLTDMGFQLNATGGVSLNNIRLFAGAPVFVFIVGRGIYKAENAGIAAKTSKLRLDGTHSTTLGQTADLSRSR